VPATFRPRSAGRGVRITRLDARSTGLSLPRFRPAVWSLLPSRHASNKRVLPSKLPSARARSGRSGPRRRIGRGRIENARRGFLAEKSQAGIRDLTLLSLDPSLHIAPKGGGPLRA